MVSATSFAADAAIAAATIMTATTAAVASTVPLLLFAPVVAGAVGFAGFVSGLATVAEFCSSRASKRPRFQDCYQQRECSTAQLHEVPGDGCHR